MLSRPPLSLLRVAASLCALLFVLTGCYRKDVPPPPPSPSYYPAEDYASDDIAGYAAEMAPAPRAKRSPSRASLAAPAAAARELAHRSRTLCDLTAPGGPGKSLRHARLAGGRS